MAENTLIAELRLIAEDIEREKHDYPDQVRHNLDAVAGCIAAVQNAYVTFAQLEREPEDPNPHGPKPQDPEPEAAVEVEDDGGEEE